MDTIDTNDTNRKPPRASDYLNGQTPHARAEEKRRKVIGWLYRWGYSSGPILMRVSGAKQSVVGKLENAKLIVGTRTEAGGITRGTPAFYYTLTEAGLQEAERLTPKLLRYPEIDRYRVNQYQIRHYLLAQDATIKALSTGEVVEFETERQVDEEGDKQGIKRPDVIWILGDGGKVGIEVELSAKWDRKLDDFILKTAKSLNGNAATATPARFERVAIVTDSPAIAARYRAALQPGKPLQIWTRNENTRWEVENTTRVPEWLIDKIDFLLIE